MAIKSASEKPDRGIEIDLSTECGNAFYLIGMAERLGKTLRKTRKEINDIREQMMAGDYENCINVFDKHFGNFVTMYRA